MMLGNQSVAQIEKRLEIEIPEPIRTEMIKTRQNNVSVPIEEGHWHCFDLPFCIVCGDKATAYKIGDALRPLQEKMKGEIQIAWTNEPTMSEQEQEGGE